MTRVNAGIDPKELPDNLLLAEHKEITRIVNAVAGYRATVADIPESFVLGPGHVKFFYNKIGYLKQRYEALYAECKARGFKVTYKGSAFNDVPENLMNDWLATLEDRKLVIERIQSKGYYLLCP